MKTVKFDGTIESAYGNPVSPALSFAGEYQAFENIDEVRQKNEVPSDDEVVTFCNNKRKANARQKSMTAALEAAGIEKPTLETDALLRLKTLYKVFIASGKSEQEARDLATSTIGVEWPAGQ
jgi:hypothetical protein